MQIVLDAMLLSSPCRRWNRCTTGVLIREWTGRCRSRLIAATAQDRIRRSQRCTRQRSNQSASSTLHVRRCNRRSLPTEDVTIPALTGTFRIRHIRLRISHTAIEALPRRHRSRWSAQCRGRRRWTTMTRALQRQCSARPSRRARHHRSRMDRQITQAQTATPMALPSIRSAIMGSRRTTDAHA